MQRRFFCMIFTHCEMGAETRCRTASSLRDPHFVPGPSAANLAQLGV
jgi:hypothetical protein